MPRRRTVVLRTESYRTEARNFSQTLISLGYNEKSSLSARHHIEDFLSFAERQNIVSIEDIPIHFIEQYVGYLHQRPNKKDGGTLHPKTIHHHIRYLNYFFEQQQRVGKIAQNPFDSIVFTYPRVKDKERFVLSQAEIRDLYEQTQNYLERAVLSLAYGCGLRAGEIERLNIVDVDFRNKIIIVQCGKGNKKRVVPMAQGVADDLEGYYFEERMYIETAEKEAFLINQRNVRYRDYCGNYLIKSLIERTGNQRLLREKNNISLHNLRHSIATHLLEQGMALEKVRDFLGHYHLETTEIYTRINQSQLKIID